MWAQYLAFIAFCVFALHAFPCCAIIEEWEKKEIVNVFNQARRTTILPAADMKMLAWDEDIARQAQAFTDACERVSKRLDGAWLAYWDRMKGPVPVAKWRTLRMAPYYDYYTSGCINTVQSNETCRHPENYKAIVLAQNERVGCGMTLCWPDEGNKGYFHACAVNGNLRIGTMPKQAWKIGPPCSACPTGWNYCVDGLCSKYPATSKPSQAPTTSRPTGSPTKYPTRAPTRYPTRKPTRTPTAFPTKRPTNFPTKRVQKASG